MRIDAEFQYDFARAALNFLQVVVQCRHPYIAPLILSSEFTACCSDKLARLIIELYVELLTAFAVACATA